MRIILFMLQAVAAFAWRLAGAFAQPTHAIDPRIEGHQSAVDAYIKQEARVNALKEELAGYEQQGKKDRAEEVKNALDEAEDQLAEAREAADISLEGYGDAAIEERRKAQDPTASRRSPQTPAELNAQRAGVPPAGSETFETHPGEGPPERAVSGAEKAAERASERAPEDPGATSSEESASSSSSPKRTSRKRTSRRKRSTAKRETGTSTPKAETATPPAPDQR